MDTLVKADLFFFITSIAVIVISILALVLFIYGIRVIRNVNKLTQKIAEEGEAIVDDVHAMRVGIKDTAHAAAASVGVASFLERWLGKHKRKGRTVEHKTVHHESKKKG